MFSCCSSYQTRTQFDIYFLLFLFYLQEFGRIQAAHKADLETITAERTKLQAELAAAATKAAAVDKDKAGMENRLDQLGVTIHQLEDKLKQRDTEVLRLEEDLGAKADEADAHAAEVAKLSDELHETKDALDQKIKALAGISMFAAQTNNGPPPSSVPHSSAKRVSPTAEPQRSKHRVRFNDVPVVRTINLDDEDLPNSQGHDAYADDDEADDGMHDGSQPQDADDWEGDAAQDSMALVVHGAPRPVRQSRQRRSQPKIVEVATDSDSEEEAEAAFPPPPAPLGVAQRNTKQRPVLPSKRSSKQSHGRNRQVLAAMRPASSHNPGLGKVTQSGGVRKAQGGKAQRGHNLFNLFGGLTNVYPGDE